MSTTSSIGDHMNIVGSDGLQVGTVDHVDGVRIELTRSGSPDGQHHYRPTSAIASIENDRVVPGGSSNEAGRMSDR